MNYELTGQHQQYFNVRGHEWPTLLVEMAQWLVQTNVAVEGISFNEQLEAPDGPYISATISHCSKYTKTLDDPFQIDTKAMTIQVLEDALSWLQTH